MPKDTARCTSMSIPINQLLRCPFVSYETEPPKKPSAPAEMLTSPWFALSWVYFIPRPLTKETESSWVYFVAVLILGISPRLLLFPSAITVDLAFKVTSRPFFNPIDN